MVEELEVIKSAAVEIAGTNPWLMIAFITLGLLNIILAFWCFLWFASKVISEVFKHIGHEFTKEEYLDALREIDDLRLKIAKDKVKDETIN